MDEMYRLSHLPPVAASARDQPVIWLLVATRLPGQPFPSTASLSADTGPSPGDREGHCSL